MRQNLVALFIVVVWIIGVPVSAIQQSVSQQKDSTSAATNSKPSPAWRVRVKSKAPVPLITLKAKDAPLIDVAAELQRQLGIPIVLSRLMKRQPVTQEFVNLPLEVAMQLLAPQGYIDYVVSGGASYAVPPKPVAVYLAAINERRPPPRGVYAEHEVVGTMVEGVVAEDEAEEKKLLDEMKKEKPLEVSYKDEKLTVSAHKRTLTNVITEIANKVGIPFDILSTDFKQVEFNEVVDWEFRDTSLEDLVRSQFPEGIRLYLRTDLQAAKTIPLRLTLEATAKTERKL